jgi:hypothetical protein
VQKASRCENVSSLRAAVTGIGAAALWLAVEPAACRLAGTPLATPRLLGRMVTRGQAWPAVGTVLHLANGAAFGVAFARLGLLGWKRGFAAAQLEGVLLWPAMTIVDRVHPDRRDGTWPPLARSGRAFAKEAAVHGVFGAALGAALARAAR